MTRSWVKDWCQHDKELSDLEAEGFWSLLKRRAGMSPIDGIITIDEGLPYTHEQLSKIFKCSRKKFKLLLQMFIDLERVSILSCGAIAITNWAHYQSEYQRQKPYRGDNEKLQPEVTTEGAPLDIDIDKEVEEEVKSIYTIWNEQEGLVTHRTLNDSTKSAIRAALKTNTVYEIIEAISTYAAICNSDEYFFTYSAWSLKQFLQGHLDTFRDGAQARKNYKVDKPLNGKPLKPEDDVEEFRRRAEAYTADILEYKFVCDSCDCERVKRFRKDHPRKPQPTDREPCPSCQQVEFHSL